MPVPAVPSDPTPPSATGRRPAAGRSRALGGRGAALLLAAALAGGACGHSDDTVATDLNLSRVVTGQGSDLPLDRTATDGADVRAEVGAGGTVAPPVLGGVAASPSTTSTNSGAAPAVKATVMAPPATPALPVAAPPTVAPAPTAAPAAADTVPAATAAAPVVTTVVPGTGSPSPTPAVSGSPSSVPAAAGPASTASVTAPESELVAGEDRSFTLLNELRAGIPVAALARDATLDAQAREWSRHMAETGEFVHSQNPYGENIAYTSNAKLTAAEAVQVFERLWSEDPTHMQNMSGPYVKVGVGVWKSDRGWYGTHLFNY